MIVKNEEFHLEDCLKSARPWVEEIVVVDTGSTDNTPQIAKKYADVYEAYTDCNYPDGEIRSFSDARQRSFDLATQPWVMWIDADDVLTGGEKLSKLCAELDAARAGGPAYAMFPYEYAHDDLGNCICLHYRERLVTPKEAFKWVNPVHEVLVAQVDNHPVSLSTEAIRVIHERQKIPRNINPRRNLRILEEFCKANSDDPRQLYYLGLEYLNTGNVEMSVKTLERYVMISGWEDEKTLALLKLSEINRDLSNYDNAIDWATKASQVKESWGECYFELAKCYYFKACAESDQGKKRRLFEKTVNLSKIGLTMPPTKSVLFVNPMERDVEIHRYLNIALNATGDVASALDSVNFALSKRPHDEQLLGNKRLYEEHLAHVGVAEHVKKLVELGTIPKTVLDMTGDFSHGRLLSDGGTKSDGFTHWKPYHRPQGYPKNVQQSDFPTAIATPHSQAWGIPDGGFVYDDLPLQMSDGQLQSLVCAIWKEYMLHDEILSAIKFLENAPYRVRHSDTTETLLRRTKEMIAWTKDEKSYDLGNSTIVGSDGNELRTDEMIAIGTPLPGAAGMRKTWITDRMIKGSSLLDFGCIDGEMTNRWGLEGFKVTGLDISTNSVRIANESAEKNGTGARHIRTFFKDASTHLRDEKFDYVTCADTYEHLVDGGVSELMIPMRKHVKDTGKMLLVTPAGAWFRGKFAKHAHPWLWADTRGDHWLALNDRGHVIAPTVWSVAEDATAAGWWVKNCTVVAQWVQDVEGQGNVCIEALPDVSSPWPDGKPILDIVLYLGGLGSEVWTPHSVDITGIGGSELAAINMAKRLVQLGNRVRVYSDCGAMGEGIYDGVEYRTYDKFHDIKCDVLIVSRWAPALGREFNVDARSRFLWVHDVVPYHLTHELALRADKILALSQWHKDNILRSFSFLNEDRVFVTRNGIDLSRFEADVQEQRDPHKVVYSSSPDRGLECLLDVWPKIRERVSDATLDVFYGFSNWEKVATGNPGQLALIENLKKKLHNLKEHGVKVHGRTNQQVLAEKFMSSGVWAYPTWFSETSCITAMEAQAAGLRVVTSPIAALVETVGSRGTMISGDWLSVDYKERFVDAVVYQMTRDGLSDRQGLIDYAMENFSWDDVAVEWNDMFKQTFDTYPTYKAAAE
jgi:glycosyltransferase involved in cell wall biosynthesis/2-polyprenyl-3-methyl-5-hydroxy-6-metoxy-1,4-benzoquinol methylase